MSFETWDPVTDHWDMVATFKRRTGHTLTLLLDGRLLVAGGVFKFTGGAASADCAIYDPSSNRWKAVGPMKTARESAQALLLHDGRVLIVGGLNSGGGHVRTGEIFDPTTSAWKEVAVPDPAPGTHVRLVVLPSHEVLVIDGVNARLWHSSQDHWTHAGHLLRHRGGFTATFLPGDERVLVAGGIWTTEDDAACSETWKLRI